MPAIVRWAFGCVLVALFAGRGFAAEWNALGVFDDAAGRFLPPVVVAPATTSRLRWNPHPAAAADAGVHVVWEDNGQIQHRTVGAPSR